MVHRHGHGLTGSGEVYPKPLWGADSAIGMKAEHQAIPLLSQM